MEDIYRLPSKAASKRAHEAQDALDMAGAFITRMDAPLGTN
jgi:hypothetical protein